MIIIINIITISITAISNAFNISSYSAQIQHSAPAQISSDASSDLSSYQLISIPLPAPVAVAVAATTAFASATSIEITAMAAATMMPIATAMRMLMAITMAAA